MMQATKSWFRSLKQQSPRPANRKSKKCVKEKWGGRPPPPQRQAGSGHLTLKRKIQSSSQQNIILPRSHRWIGHVYISKRILPSQPAIDLRHSAKIKSGAVLSGLTQIRVEIEFLRESRSRA